MPERSRCHLRGCEEPPALLGVPLETHCHETVNGLLDEQATRSAPERGWKLNRSKPARLAEAPELLSQDCRHLAKCDTFRGQLATRAPPAPRARE
jgi:hypothetical protein